MSTHWIVACIVAAYIGRLAVIVYVARRVWPKPDQPRDTFYVTTKETNLGRAYELVHVVRRDKAGARG